ncbi:MAG TPA: 3-isopropylmalate dehydrogenase [Blastocatellia bacterium]|nr:3-isopropylmalate dehydrogenase [Blastocatellia bacterium]
MDLVIATLPGEGVGPEVTAEAVKILRAVGRRFGHRVTPVEHLIGGVAVDRTGNPLPDDTIKGCLASKAVLLGAVGGPQYDQNPRGLKPEDGLLALRRELGVFANLRPVVVYDELVASSPLRPEVARGCDLLVVRELLSGLYYGRPRGFEGDSEVVGNPISRSEDGAVRAFNTMSYTVEEIERIARVAFQAAMQRKRKVTSVDKANVLEVSQLWRAVVTRVGRDYPEVALDHALVDSCAMQLVRDPRRFDVIVTENMFGDILSDEAAVIAGSIGMLASASLGGAIGLYEPIHGSAPDIAGQGKANPLGAIGSAAMMLRYSFALEQEARAVETGIHKAIARGLRTADLATGAEFVTTSQMGDAVAEAITEV